MANAGNGRHDTGLNAFQSFSSGTMWTFEKNILDLEGIIHGVLRDTSF